MHTDDLNVQAAVVIMEPRPVHCHMTLLCMSCSDYAIWLAQLGKTAEAVPGLIYWTELISKLAHH